MNIFDPLSIMQCTFGAVCFVLATEENLFGAKFSALLKGSTSKAWRVLLYQKHPQLFVVVVMFKLPISGAYTLHSPRSTVFPKRLPGN